MAVSGYLYQGVDVLGSLDGMISKLQDGAYDGEMSVQQELFDLVTSAYDFHFVYWPDIMNVFTWQRTVELVSVSLDGQSLPDIYAVQDISSLTNANGSYYRPSAVTQINGTDSQEWLNRYVPVEYSS
jgi:hypothetical protein